MGFVMKNVDVKEAYHYVDSPKIGTVVRTKTERQLKAEFGEYWQTIIPYGVVPEMLPFLGTNVTIKDVIPFKKGCDIINIEECRFNWHVSLFVMDDNLL